MIHLYNLLDDAKCYNKIRELRCPVGLKCPYYRPVTLTKQGRYNT